MDIERYRRLRQLFHEAVELHADARAAFVIENCDGDDELRAELEALLAQDGGDGDVLGELVRGAAVDFPATDGQTPSQIGPYPLLGKIAEGGMGVVHLGWDPTLMRRVAIKQLPPEIVHDPASLARFHQEAQLLAAINHPNIATIHSLEEHDGIHFLTMEYIEGESLKARLARASMEMHDALSVCREIATALVVAHRSGVVHRDVKPANVMITPDGLVKVLDFGLATTVSNDGVATENSRGAGTPGYMSPEQLRGEKTGYATDIWALGCILYECLTGQPAFPGTDAQERNAATLRGEIDATALPRDIDDELRELLFLCLEPSVTRRVDRITRIRTLLGSVLGGPAPTRGGKRFHNLPSTLSSFVGRADEISRLRKLVRVHRLVSMTGPGGSGKTRLSVEVGAGLRSKFADGVWQVELAPLSNPDLVAQEVASVLHIREQANKSVEESLTAGIAERSMLLLLDNCEHVLASASELAGLLLRHCENLHIVATSREKLGITGEIVFQVPPLGLPPSAAATLDEIGSVESVQLFVDRASAETHGFTLGQANAAAVARICRQLDGIPLAIELAAARVGVLSVREIAERLGDRFRLLSSGRKSSIRQHQTLRALVDWSYDLLGTKEKQLLRALSIFAGSWTLQAVERVCAIGEIQEEEILDLHSRLVEKSLLEVDSEGCRTCEMARYRMLDTIRSYTAERMAEGQERARLRKRHREYFLSFAEDSHAQLDGPERVVWFDLWRTEQDNFRQALEAFEEDGEIELALRLAAALGLYWDISGQFSEGWKTLSRLLDRNSDAGRTAYRGLALQWAGTLIYRQQDYDRAARFLEASLAIREELGDAEGIASVRDCLAGLFKALGEPTRAREQYELSLELFRSLGNENRLATTLAGLGNLAIQQHDFPTAHRCLEEGLELSRKIQSPGAVLGALFHLSMLAIAERRHEDARELLDEAWDLAQLLDEPHEVASVLHNKGRLAERVGELQESRRLQTESLRIRWELRDRFCSARCILSLGVLATRVGEFEKAARLFGATDAILEEIQAPLSPLYRAERREGIARLQAELPAEILEAEWSKGAAMSAEEAVDHALGD